MASKLSKQQQIQDFNPGSPATHPNPSWVTQDITRVPQARLRKVLTGGGMSLVCTLGGTAAPPEPALSTEEGRDSVSLE